MIHKMENCFQTFLKISQETYDKIFEKVSEFLRDPKNKNGFLKIVINFATRNSDFLTISSDLFEQFLNASDNSYLIYK